MHCVFHLYFMMQNLRWNWVTLCKTCDEPGWLWWPEVTSDNIYIEQIGDTIMILSKNIKDIFDQLAPRRWNTYNRTFRVLSEENQKTWGKINNTTFVFNVLCLHLCNGLQKFCVAAKNFNIHVGNRPRNILKNGPGPKSWPTWLSPTYNYLRGSTNTWEIGPKSLINTASKQANIIVFCKRWSVHDMKITVW